MQPDNSNILPASDESEQKAALTSASDERSGAGSFRFSYGLPDQSTISLNLADATALAHYLVQKKECLNDYGEEIRTAVLAELGSGWIDEPVGSGKAMQFLEHLHSFPTLVKVDEIKPWKVNQILDDECVRCAVASLFGLSRLEVPHFYRMKGHWFDEVKKWAQFNDWQVDDVFPDEELPEWSLGWGPSKRPGNPGHMVVCGNHGGVWHDPSGAGIKEFEGYLVFEKIL